MNSQKIIASFTSKEKAVLKLIMLGKPNKEIAKELALSIRTVEYHITQLFLKVGVYNRTELALWGKDHIKE